MTDDRKSGIALIAGSLGGILTMAIHPTAAGSLTAQQAEQLSLHSGVAHSIAIVSVVVLFLGACGLARSIAATDRVSFAGIVTFGFACVAVMIAAAVSGFIVPSILKHMVRDDTDAAHQWQIVTVGIFQINQAFSRIYSVGASVAIILWSVSVLKNGVILGIGVGNLRLDVHGMAAVWLGQAIWFIVAGSQLCSRTAGSLSTQ